jgi:acetyl-CoA carboxylase biotin carboxyl carrier protein
MDVEKLKAILAVLEGSKVSRFDWSDGKESLRIQLGHPPAAVSHAAPLAPAAAAPVQASSAAPAPAHASPPAAAAAGHALAAARAEAKAMLVTSPFVGTFYRSASPEAPHFVEPGTVVKKGQVLCIVEAMKLMNEIEAEQGGRVVEVLVPNGSPVEFGEPLFRLEPA